MYAADRACINSLRHALDICDRLADDMLGVAVDVYHVWWDPDLEAQIGRAGSRRLFGFHVCDWLVPTRDLLLDRGMMGDGVIDLARIRGWMDRAGYAGPIEVEIFSARTGGGAIRRRWSPSPNGNLRTSCDDFGRRRPERLKYILKNVLST